jgi:2-aminoadipate transaminase
LAMAAAARSLRVLLFLDRSNELAQMGTAFSDRMADVPRSFIREILKVTSDDSVISFAGGLPNRKLFPVAAIREATLAVLDTDAGDALQYAETEGYAPLRKWISERYAKTLGLAVDPNDILVTTGSQQGLDLLGKVLVNEREKVGIEQPGYLGAIQAFSMYRPIFSSVPLEWDGIDIAAFERAVRIDRVRLFYAVPNFQNPSGISYSDAKRSAAADILRGTATLLVEDDPYGELGFAGARKRSFYGLARENTVLLGSFSKIFVPSLRIGWMVAARDLMDKLVIAKQATDLHTNHFGQRLLHRYLTDNDIDAHIRTIRQAYGSQRDAMLAAIRAHFPPSVKFSEPEGGMFLWVELPGAMSALKIFEKAIAEKVAFVPGDPFYVGRSDVSTMRLNFSCVDEATIHKGIAILGKVLKNAA